MALTPPLRINLHLPRFACLLGNGAPTSRSTIPKSKTFVNISCAKPTYLGLCLHFSAQYRRIKQLSPWCYLRKTEVYDSKLLTMRIIGSYEYRKFLNLFTYLLQVGGIQDGWNRKGLVSETGIKKKSVLWVESLLRGKSGRQRVMS